MKRAQRSDWGAWTRIHRAPHGLVGDAWVERTLDETWRVALRLGVDPAGRVVISELRLFPVEPLRLGNTSSFGEWSASRLGVRARGVPAGGVTARVLRRVNLGDVHRFVQTIAAKDVARLLDVGFVKPTRPRPKTTRKRTRRGPGRPASYPLSFYRRLAAAYTASAAGGRGYARELAERFGTTPAQIRSAVHRCRHYHGLL